MVMSSLKSSLQTLIKSETNFNNIIPSLNETIYENTLPEMFITMFYGRVDQETNEFVYCNGGHNYPMLIRNNGDIELLKAGGLILGIFPDSNYEIATLSLESGDTILCYTDGITEAINSKNEEYGDGRLLNFVKENRTLSPESLIEGIIEDVSAFQGTARQYDDITLFALKMR
jgi:sigma-B regulation protein RsbU (phosphoserine phosphatase)